MTLIAIRAGKKGSKMLSEEGTEDTERKGDPKTGRSQPCAGAGRSATAEGTALGNSLWDKLGRFTGQNKGQCGWGREGKGRVLPDWGGGGRGQGLPQGREGVDLPPGAMNNYWGSQLGQ